MSSPQKMLLTFFSVICMLFFAVEGYALSILDREKAFSGYFDYPCAKFRIPKVLAMAIARQESYMQPWILNLAGKDVHPSTREEALYIAKRALDAGISFDVGMMQINSYWIKKYKLPLEKVLEPSNNVYLGCWILAQEIQRHGFSWRAVAYYHTPLHRNPERGIAYVKRIRKHLNDILVSYNLH